jgi:hypothetical protein
VSQTSPPEPDEPLWERLRQTDTRLDHYIDRYAARAHGMTASAIRALFAVANRPEVVSLAGGMPNITDLPLDVVGSVLNDLVLNDGRRAMQYGSGSPSDRSRVSICSPGSFVIRVTSCSVRLPATSAHSGSSVPINARSSMSRWMNKA